MAGVRLRLNKNALKTFIDKRQDLFRDNVKIIVKNKALPHLVNLIMKGYDNLSAIAETGPDDPTSPANWRAEFLAKLEEDIEQTFTFTGNRILVQMGDKDFLGYDPSGEIDPDDTEPLHWLVFFLEGLIGDWAFITPETYERLRGTSYKPTWGRFNDGFMLSRQAFESEGWDRLVNFEEVRHSFSGFSPVDIFSEAFREFQLRPFIELAVNATVKGERVR